MISHKNIHRAPGTTILGSLIIIAAVAHWYQSGQWTEGHTAVSGMGVMMLFSPDSLRKSKGPA